jgi:NitT/TauT family transport system substrate-binding protein
VHVRRPNRLITGLLCVLALVGVAATAGCTNESGSSDEPIKLGYGPFPGWLPWRVAEAQGLFEENGINVELKYFENVSDGNTAMANGALDANNQTLNDTLTMLTGGAQAQKIVTVNDTSTGADQIIARDGISSLSELRGKTIAVEEGIVSHYWLRLAMREVGLTFDDVTLNLMTTNEATAAFQAEQVDAVVNYAPFTTEALKRRGAHPIATTAEFPDACSNHLSVSTKMIENRRDDVQALVDTWFDTLDWINSNQDAANEIMAEQVNVAPQDFQKYASGLSTFTLQQNVDAFTPGITSKNLNFNADDVADFLIETGLSETRPRTDGLLDGSFVEAAVSR